MSDYRDDDAQFKDWLNKRPPENEDENVPASVTFMEMMRRTAAKANAPVPRVEPTPDPNDLPPAPPVDAAPPAGVEAAPTAPTQTGGGAPPPPNKGSGKGDGNGSPRRSQRGQKRVRRRLSMVGGFLRSIIVVVVAAGLMATIFTWWTPNGFIADGVRAELSIVMATQAVPTIVPTSQPTPNWAMRIGIVSGHRGPEDDPGAVCPDGLTEAEINFAVAQRVVDSLRGLGYTVDLLDEFDPRLQNYQAAALVSIHANTCQSWGIETVSGYLIAAAAARISARGNDDALVECIAGTYAASTQLQRRTGVTIDMTDYHSFREIHPLTPAAIIELGFMLADRDLLVNRQEDMARGITDGVLCYLSPPV
ncbi:MAG: N-acetylmuramoyl-L-alanine amidase [Chloroflexi bacterium]|nr:N-acetylmuramoyl-L-alanine amidase [Chloroflexota bacterium]